MNQAYIEQAEYVMPAPFRRSIGMEKTMALPAILTNKRSKAVPLDFAALYEQQFKNLYSYAVSITRQHESAEDVVSQAFEKAYRKQNAFNPRKGSAEAWLFRIARNTALDYLRKAKKNPVVPMQADVRGGVTNEPDVILEKREEQGDVGRLLSTVSGREREILSLKFFAELSNQDIAAIIGVTETNVGTLLHRTLERLRRGNYETIQ